ncbi:zf-HC2 domain-containing protein [Streptomyces katsurahamanus]|uniref:Putative zinc-finger domain-containing protein n=1 Tax=Streptomyces katsurahamanus TaxID=2577098 RepID=A0ABW9NQG9_9ACTN|nr:zf-HC2 domain-containing protein [Streptomyces katsurahamanus]MQS35543.1 hypothetical protein [Streptomyces katsurahamanus]
MSASSPTPAEQHLGDRLAALVDGELKHDARDRVLAHLATCSKCKAEADAQRRLKDVFAQAAPPSPSEGLLARLQGLPAGPGGDSGGGPFDGGSVIDAVFGGVSAPAGRPGDRRPETFGYVPGAHAGTAVLPSRSGGFRIHEVGRHDAERSAWRGRRFAFAAASAVSLAAIALGGALPLDASGPSSRGGTGNSVTPLGAAASSGALGGSAGVPSTTPAARSAEFERRRQAAQAPARSEERVIGHSVPGLLTPGDPLRRPSVPSVAPHRPAAPPVSLLSSVFSPPPLIRPVDAAFQLASAHGVTPSATPSPPHLATPEHPSLRSALPTSSLTPHR